MTLIVLIGVLLLAYVNGANDNTKGVATLVGSSTLSYRQGLALATAATGLGSITSVFLAGTLIRTFSGKGLVAAELLTPAFLAAVAIGAALTVLLATRLGMPVSTTHAIVGGLVGAGWVQAGSALDLAALGRSFALPLALGPLLAVALAYALLTVGRSLGRRIGVRSESCICIGSTWVPITPAVSGQLFGRARAAAAVPVIGLAAGDGDECRRRYLGRVAGLDAQSALDFTHVLSASLVSFARGLNDTPKIVGLAVATSSIPLAVMATAVGGVMALGGILQARRVTETLAHKITPISAGHGTSGNLATSLLVVGASRLGLPVSTTHVSTGAIFGIGGASGTIRWSMAGEVVAAWLATLPAAAACSALLGYAFTRLI